MLRRQRCHNQVMERPEPPLAAAALLTVSYRLAAPARIAAMLLGLAAAAGALAVAEGPGRATTYAGRSAAGAALAVCAGLGLVAAGLVVCLGPRPRRTGDLALLAGFTWFAPVWAAWQNGPPLIPSLAMVGGGFAARPAQAPAVRRPRDHVRWCGGGAGDRAAEAHGRGSVQRCPVRDLRRRLRRDHLPGRWPHLRCRPRPGGAPRYRPDRGQPGPGAFPGISPDRAGGGAARSRAPDRLLAPGRAAVRRCKRPRGARTRSKARGHGHPPDEERPHGRGRLPRRVRSRA